MRTCYLLAIIIICACSTDALATPITLTFPGIQLSVVGEFINAVPVPVADQQFAPLFKGGQTITASVAYDTNQPDVDPSPNTGTYTIGTLSISIPELGLMASRLEVIELDSR